jgi:two-component system, LytTR family, response regulator LytT
LRQCGRQVTILRYTKLAMQNRVTTSPAGTITTILADDENLAREELAYQLADFPDIEIAATASNGIEAVKLIEDLEPDLVFMDVQMPGLDGMSVIRKLREKNIPLPYFVMATAYDRYAVEAFRVEALDYLLKPVEKDRLAEAVEKARRAVGEKLSTATPEPVYGAKPALQRSKLLVRSQQRNLIVDAQDVVYATIEDGLITVVTTTLDGQSNYRTIEELQSNLDPDTFWRVHRSFLVNIHRIKEVIPWFKSSFQLRMDDRKQTEIPVSRVQTKRLRALLKL